MTPCAEINEPGRTDNDRINAQALRFTARRPAVELRELGLDPGAVWPGTMPASPAGGVPMAFSDFQYPDVLRQFGLTAESVEDLFAGVAPVPPSPFLRDGLPMTALLAAANNSEKARSEWMVAPVLADFWGRYHGRIGLYSGRTFAADPAAGLTGLCDYLVCRGPQGFDPGPPVLVAFEAKNESIPGGMGQCVAAMVGADRYNRRENAPYDPIYGCVTTGSVWRFLRLSGTVVTHGLREYGIGEVDRLLGILIHVTGPPPAAV